MKIDSWLTTFEEAFNEVGKPFTEVERDFLFKEYSKSGPAELLEKFLEIVDIYIRFFFNKATDGDTFGSLKQVEEEFGQSIEDRYGYSTGPFINLAKCYWTYRFEVDKITMKYWNLFLFQILRNVETKIAGIFFPTPGPQTMSSKERKSKQLQILQEYAPRINTDEFFAQNPIIKTGGCLGSIVLILSVIFLLLIVIFNF